MNLVRDYMWEHPAGPYTADEVQAGLGAAKNGKPSLKAVRKSLQELAGHGLLNTGSKQEPPDFRYVDTYKWNPLQGKPFDYKPVTPPKAPTLPTAAKGQPMAVASTPSAPSVPPDDHQKREQLRARLKLRMDEIKNVKQEKAEQEAIPVPKKNAQPGVTRSNGETYYPREIAGKSDVEVLRMLRNATPKTYPLLSGPPGTGKTVLVDAAFHDQPGGLYTLTGDENTSVMDFVGQFSPTGHPENPFVWADGPLICAMRAGGVFFIDDATLINPKALAVMYPVMDGRNYITVKDHMVADSNGVMHPDVVHSAPGFFVVAAHNPGVHGAILTDALSSRFTWQMWVETDLELAASLGVNPRFLKLVKALQTDRAGGQGALWIPQLRELLTTRNVAKMFGEVVAARNLLAQTPEDDREWMASKMRLIFGEEVTMLELGGQL